MKKIILKDPFISERSKPQNIKDKDEHLFKHEYKNNLIALTIWLFTIQLLSTGLSIY